MKYTTDDFSRAIYGKFPVLRKKFSKNSEWVYGQAATLASFINDALKAADLTTVNEALFFAEKYFLNADEALTSVFQCDFFEVLDLRGLEGSKAFSRLDEKCRHAYQKAQKYIGTPYKPD